MWDFEGKDNITYMGNTAICEPLIASIVMMRDLVNNIFITVADVHALFGVIISDVNTLHAGNN